MKTSWAHQQCAHCGICQKQFQSSGSNATITVLTLQIVLLFCFPKCHQLKFSYFATCEASFQISEVFLFCFFTKMVAKAKQTVSEHFKCHFCDQHVNSEKLPAQSIISHSWTLKISELCLYSQARYA